MARLSEAYLDRFYRLADHKLLERSGSSSSWVPAFPEGRFMHPEYGELNFTPAVLDEYRSNFDAKVRSIDLAVDIDHKQEAAAGWIKQLQYQDGVKPGLYAYVEWNNLGVSLLADKQYKYISPQFGEYTDEATGEVYPNTLTCLTLTNFPFLKRMPAIALSEPRHRTRPVRSRVRVLTDKRTGLPILGADWERRAQRYASQRRTTLLEAFILTD